MSEAYLLQSVCIYGLFKNSNNQEMIRGMFFCGQIQITCSFFFRNSQNVNMIHFQSAHQLIFAFGIYRISLIKLWLHECSLLAGCNLVFIVWINVYGILFVFIPDVSLLEESVCVASNDKMMVEELLFENSDALFELPELLFIFCFF